MVSIRSACDGQFKTAGGPYWVPISQKMGPYLKAWGSLLVLETVLSGVEFHTVK